MLTAAAEIDVLIVGAGPVGLFLANECARRGLRWRIVEARASQSVHSKALAIFPRTLEILDMAGLIGPFLDAANRVGSVAVASHERTLATIRFAPTGTPYPFVAMVPQNVTEHLLLQQLQHKGGAVEYDTTFVSATEHDRGVIATVERNGHPLTIRTSYVVGCDGAHSAVRHLLHLPFEGKEYAASFMLADIDTDGSLPAGQLQLCPNQAGPLAIFPIGATRRRIVAIVKDAEGDAPSLELVRKLLAERAPTGIHAHALHWSSYFRVHHRHVAQLRVGRMFIAGDAAHIHSPFGGQGMNTGLHDVWNLAWKLDFAVRGQASEELLDSYTAERLPVIKSVIQTTDLLTKAMGTASKFAQTLRDTLIPAVSHLVPFQHAFVKRLSGLGIEYGGSSIVAGAGERYFDDSMRGGNGIGSRFLLITKGNRTFLVRPDGYVASSGRTGDRNLPAALRAVLERQTHQPPVRRTA